MNSLKVEASRGGAWFSSGGRVAWLSLDDLTSPRDALEHLREKGIECELSLVEKVLKDLEPRTPRVKPEKRKALVDPAEVEELKEVVTIGIKGALAGWFESKLLGSEEDFHKYVEEYTTDLVSDACPHIFWKSRGVERCVKHYIEREVKKLSPSEILKLADEVLYKDGVLFNRLQNFSWDLADRILSELRRRVTLERERNEARDSRTVR